MECCVCRKELQKTNCVKTNGEIYCNKHFQQIKKFGHVLDTNPRTQFDLNDYNFIDEKTVEVICYNHSCKESGRFLVDKDDWEKICDKKWRIWKDSIFTGNMKPKSLISFILDYDSTTQVIDHINGNRFDNRKENLLVCEQKNNLCNKHFMSNNTSGFIGVYYDSYRYKWIAEIRIDNQKCMIGRFNKLEEAIFSRYLAEKALFQQYRATNNDNAIFQKIDNLTKIEQENVFTKTQQRILTKYNVNITR